MEPPGSAARAHDVVPLIQESEGTAVTPEQLEARVLRGDAALLGPDGVVLALGDGAVIGRGRDAAVIVRDATVSWTHARIERVPAGWRIVDLGSTNGTWVDGLRVTSALMLRDGASVRLGDVVLRFATGMHARRAPRRRRTTAPVIVVATLAVPGLGANEQALLALLVRRRHEARGDAERAWVTTREIAEAVGFRSVAADGDNVRELVMRLRRKLAAAGIVTGVDGRRGAGYRLDAEIC